MEININGYIVLIDEDFLPIFNQYKWRINVTKGKNNTFLYIKNSKHEYMHRIIMGLAKGNKLQVDHINHNTLDNRKANLRVVTRSQNLANQPSRPFKNGVMTSSKYKGVTKLKNGRFLSQISIDGRPKSLGCYLTEESAAKAYNTAAKTIFGDCAFLNKIEAVCNESA